MKPPAHEDAILLLAILNGATGEQALEGMELLWTFKEAPTYDQLVSSHPPGSLGYRNVMSLLTTGERLGTFVKNGVLNRELTLDLIWMAGVWERTRMFVEDLRVLRSNQKLFENLEYLGKPRLGSDS